jgi:hypothetical protein
VAQRLHDLDVVPGRREVNTMDDLIAFISARLDEDEAAARACADNDGNLGWRDSPVQASLGDHTIRTTGSRPVARVREADSRGDESVPRILSPAAVAAHIVRNDPARVLREVKAKRSVLWRCDGRVNEPDQYPNGLVSPRAVLARQALMDLGAVWSDHADYRAEWQTGVRQ